MTKRHSLNNIVTESYEPLRSHIPLIFTLDRHVPHLYLPEDELHSLSVAIGDYLRQEFVTYREGKGRITTRVENGQQQVLEIDHSGQHIPPDRLAFLNDSFAQIAAGQDLTLANGRFRPSGNNSAARALREYGATMEYQNIDDDGYRVRCKVTIPLDPPQFSAVRKAPVNDLVIVHAELLDGANQPDSALTLAGRRNKYLARALCARTEQTLVADKRVYLLDYDTFTLKDCTLFAPFLTHSNVTVIPERRGKQGELANAYFPQFLMLKEALHSDEISEVDITGQARTYCVAYVDRLLPALEPTNSSNYKQAATFLGWDDNKFRKIYDTRIQTHILEDLCVGRGVNS